MIFWVFEIILFLFNFCIVVIWNYDVIVFVVLKCCLLGCLDVFLVLLKIWMKMVFLFFFEVINWYILILIVVCVIYVIWDLYIWFIWYDNWNWKIFYFFNVLKMICFLCFFIKEFFKIFIIGFCLNFLFIWKKNIFWWKKKRLFSWLSLLCECWFFVIVLSSVLGCEVDCEWNM